MIINDGWAVICSRNEEVTVSKFILECLDDSRCRSWWGAYVIWFHEEDMVLDDESGRWKKWEEVKVLFSLKSPKMKKEVFQNLISGKNLEYPELDMIMVAMRGKGETNGAELD